MLKEAHPELIEVVGGQVMNTHTSFHRRMLHAEEAHAAYNIALRTSTGYEASLARREPVHAHPHPLLHRVTGLCCARAAECRRRPAAQSNPLRARRDLGLWRAARLGSAAVQIERRRGRVCTRSQCVHLPCVREADGDQGAAGEECCSLETATAQATAREPTAAGLYATRGA